MKAIFGLILVIVCVAGCSHSGDKEITASGTIEGTDVTVAAEVGGKVKEVRVSEGSRINKGDTLALLNHVNSDIELRQAEAAVAAADAQYRLLTRGTRNEDLLQAEANFKNAQQDFQRLDTLFSAGTVSQKQRDDAETKYILARQQFEKLKRGPLSEEIGAAKARLDQSIAQADLIRKRISDSYVLSPSPGIITLKAVEPGEFVTIGMNLFRITYLDKVKLTIYVNETELGRIHFGQKASVTTDTKGGKPFEGEVIYISPSAEFTPKNVQTKDERTKLVFAVKIEVANPEGVLKPGLPADATLHAE